MPAKRLTDAEIKRVVRLVEKMLRAGYAPISGRSQNRKVGAVAAAAKEAARLGWTKATDGHNYVRHRLRQCEPRGIAGPDWSIKPKSGKQAKSGHPRAEIPRSPPVAEVAKTTRILAIPDVHICPTSPDISRLEWIGRHAQEMNPDWIIQGGDLLTADSVEMHSQPGTLGFEKNPRIKADFDILERGLTLFDRGLGSRWRGRKAQTKGNHEYRFDRFEDRNPQCQGLFVERYESTMNAHGWAVYEFGKYLFVEGVGFIHIPLNTMGRPYGGKTSAQRIANDSVFSLCHFHTHQFQFASAAKMDGHRVDVISAGCALADGHLEHYAKHSLTGWRYGCLELTVRGGQILDHAWVSMHTLGRRYRGAGRSR